jgi:transposase-like protein
VSGQRYQRRTRSRVRRLYAGGTSISEISRRTDVPVWTIRAWVADINPCSGNERRYDRDQIAAELAAGIPYSQICRRHGCSKRWLSDLANGRLAP